MLETVRAYATERLAAAPDRADTERRHTNWVVTMTDAFVHAGAAEFRRMAAQFEQELPNLRAAVERVIDAGDAPTAALLIRNSFGGLRRRSAEREAIDWLDRTLPMAASAPDAVRGRMLVLKALIEGLFGDRTAVRSLLDEGRRLLPDDTQQPEYFFDHAIAAAASIGDAVAEGSLEVALAAVEDASARFSTMGQPLGGALMALSGGGPPAERW